MWKSNVASIPRSEKVLKRASCTAAESVGDCVLISGPPVGTLYQVRKMIPTVLGTMPAVGVITKKYSVTTCRVQLFGPLKGIYVALLPGRTYWVGKDSRLTSIVPSPSVGEVVYLQGMGTAVGDSEVVLSPGLPTITRG